MCVWVFLIVKDVCVMTVDSCIEFLCGVRVKERKEKNTCWLTCQDFLARAQDSEPTNQIAATRKLQVI